ncbi:sulfatase [Acidilobus saccharovorans 345-15]|uniref:Sulfatase n=1 Tax=Acidilobus saccharovorans (strain DSM 16705 / JCM 18335 / VKM B-2471 / 345-15) TaxID=666510 RepID=D9Q169_ACIS3|nr:sulfatase-like hydrolase/transferase [Acidilobus saccharovorans]ADL19057.1 sulfatase [Acidilobus saccharovorans 345-15]
MAGAPTNVAIVLCDTLRRDVLDVYGGTVSTRPLLEALGNRAIVYTGYSNSFWTVPSHFSLFTGLQVDRHGVHEGPNRNTLMSVSGLGRSFSGHTLASELKRRGFYTIGFSANSLVSYISGLNKGFECLAVNDSWLIYGPLFTPIIALNNLKIIEELGAKHRGRLKYLSAFLDILKNKGVSGAASITALYFKVRLLRALSDYVADKGYTDAISTVLWDVKGEPFLLFVNIMEAHEPYYYNDPYFINNAKWDYKIISCARCVRREFKGYLKGASTCVRAAAEIANVLRSKGLLGRTLFIFTSDHGQEFAEHGAIGHNSGHLYEENIGIPIIVKPPEGMKLSRSDCYVGLHELYGLAMAAASGDREWAPSCGPGLAESYEAVAPDPNAGRGIRRVAVFLGRHKAVFRLNDDKVEEVAEAGRPLDLGSDKAKGVIDELRGHLPSS